MCDKSIINGITPCKGFLPSAPSARTRRSFPMSRGSGRIAGAMALLIKNGQIVTPSDNYIADIYCEDQTITKIGKNLDAPPNTQVIDASGKYVFPGFIDPHVHIYLPFMGTYAKDTYETASKAALIGGTTTLIEMVCPSDKEQPLEAFELWKSKGEGKSACDFTFHMGVSPLRRLSREPASRDRQSGRGVVQDLPGVQGRLWDRRLRAVSHARLAKELGVIVTAHCENADLVCRASKEADRRRQDWHGIAHEQSRPVQVEAEGVHHLMTFAAMHGTHTLHRAHVLR